MRPALAAGVDTRNPRRVVRALEIAELRGDGPPPPPRGYPGPIAWLGLAVHPHAHAARIATRARAQFDAGLIEEARALRERFDPGLPAFSAIGYREAWAVLDGELTRDAAIELDAQRNLAFSKRQRTWFRSEPDITWLDAHRRAAGARGPRGRACRPWAAFSDRAVEAVRGVVEAHGTFAGHDGPSPKGQNIMIRRS